MDNIAQEVKKPVEAIQCTNTFSLVQRKMYNVLLANAEGKLRPDVTHRIRIGQLCEGMGYNSNDYEKIKNSFRQLKKIDIEWDIINEDGNKVWTITSPLSLARVIEGEGICEYEFTKGLLPYLDKPAQYAKFSLAIQSKFRSRYGLALYENCERYRKIGYTKAFEVNIFRKLMGLKEDEYPDFFAMKRRVIDIAVREVNEHANFTITPEFEKSGRKIIKIKFNIEIKTKITKTLVTNATQDELLNLLKIKFALSDKDIINITQKYSNEYISEKIEYVLNTPAFKAGEINNMGGYLTTALAYDYKNQISSKEILQEMIHDAEKLRQAEEGKQKQLHAARYEYTLYVDKLVLDIVLNMTEEQRIVFTANFEKYLSENDKIAHMRFKSNGYKGFIVTRYLKNYIKEFNPATLNEIITFEEYLKQHNLALYELTIVAKEQGIQ